MLKASEMTMMLTESDLTQAMLLFSTAITETLTLSLEEGVLLVKTRVTHKRLPFAVPIDLRLRVQGVDQTMLRMHVTWSNLPLLPEALKEFALQKAFDVLPGRYTGGVLQIDLSDLLDQMPVQFRLESVRFEPRAMWLRLVDVNIFPIEPGALVVAPEVLPTPTQAEATLPEHQSYYQKLRQKAVRWADTKAPAWVRPLVPWVLAVPDFFALLVRLFKDERVPGTAKVIIGCAIAYFLSPIDIFPDLLPLIGHVDDIALALFALEQVSRRVPEAVIQESWPGDGRVLEMINAGTGVFRKALPTRILAAILRVLKARRP